MTSKAPWWASSPIIVLPLAAAAVGLVFVPFLVTSTDHAAEFFGAFTAAIVAAAAALSGFFIQAELTNRRAMAEKSETDDRNALLLYAHLLYVKKQLERAVRIFGSLQFVEIDGLVTPTDQTATTAKVVRRLIPPIETMSFEKIMEVGGAFPHDVTLLIAEQHFEIAVELASFRLEMIGDDEHASRTNITGAIQNLNGRIALISQTMSNAEKVLKARSLL